MDSDPTVLYKKGLKMHNCNIVLTGFMGTGKTTIGKILAEKLGYKFVDTDDWIMSQCNMSVTEIFETEGEDAFRAMERELALELGQKDGLVISTGGRMMLDAANKDALEKNGRIFCLVADPDEIMHRVSRDHEIDRPLLKTENPKKRVLELLKERKDGYDQFYQLDTTGLSPAEVSKTLLTIFYSNRSRV